MSPAATPYGRIRAAIEYLAEHHREQPGLESLARRAGLSPCHFQRIFTRWAGVSPKAFLRQITRQHLKARLGESTPLLEAAIEAGLSGPGRLHDLFISTEGMTPGEYRRLGAGLTLRHGSAETPYGRAFAAWTGRGLCALEFLPDGGDGGAAAAALAERWPGAVLREDDERIRALMGRVFDPSAARPPLHVAGNRFQLLVWEALLRLPEGALISYGRLAALAGHPGAARAAGSAVGSNPVAVLIPCHRVIRASGAVTGYRWGTGRKLALLGRELARAEERKAGGPARRLQEESTRTSEGACE
ncbi:MAG: methylated-DNA--[protein]-cysteine S-methyltransferase [Gammaproteobacteria bacterium]|nr:methylated-DNA--[protein]-cysteine S-methyltransferase [Gammaproteobacteria bacterium]